MKQPAYKYYVLYSLLVVYIFNFVDRQIMALFMEPIKQDLDLSDTQLGFMTGIAFAIFYTTLGIPIARLADKRNRVTIISWAIAIWSAMTVLSGMAVNFWQLVAARIGVGIGEAGCTPAAYSIIADYFPQQERSHAVAVYMLGVPLGIMMGFLLGGWINELYGWRWAFIAMGVPGLVVAVLVKLTVKEPIRGRYDHEKDAEAQEGTLVNTFNDLWAKSSFRWLVSGMALTAFVGAGVGQWQSTFFIRHHGMSTGELGSWMSVMAGLCGVIGIFLGDYLPRKLGRSVNNERKQMRLIALTVFLLMFASAASVLVSNRYLGLCWVGVGTALYFMHYGPAYALVIRLAHSRMRAMTSALVLLIVNLVGSGLGPQMVGIISDLLMPRLGSDSLRISIVINLSILIAAALCFFQVSKTAQKDLVLEERES